MTPSTPQRIDNCFDSHVHWLATGAFSERVNLSHLKSPEDILTVPVPQGSSWILGYGWSFSTEHIGQLTKELLDQWCGDRPVALSKSDGHGLWVNTKALEIAGLFDPNPTLPEDLAPRNEDGSLKGLLFESARTSVFDAAKSKSEAELCRQLLKAQKIFHSFGITHIRDVGMNKEQFEAALQLESSGLLKLCVEGFVYDDKIQPKELIELALELKQRGSPKIRIQGVKIFLDGSLGSETAAISETYQSGSGQGWLKYNLEELIDIIKVIWSNNLEVAVHTIGDKAVDLATEAANQVQNGGANGKIHFEHLEIARVESLEKMKALNAVVHFQPSHWLEDKKWLDKKLSPQLFKCIFPWRKVQELDIPIFFGSDSPMSSPNPFLSEIAVKDSVEGGVPKLLGNALTYHTYPDLSWAPNTYSIFNNGKLDHIVFEGEHL